LGVGGFGSVWRAQDVRSGRNYALKVIQGVRSDGAITEERIRLEASVRIDSPHIVPAVGLRQWDASTFLILFEFFRGVTLEQRMIENPLSDADKKVVFEKILLGVRDAHRHNVIHRDLKPSNI